MNRATKSKQRSGVSLDVHGSKRHSAANVGKGPKAPPAPLPPWQAVPGATSQLAAFAVGTNFADLPQAIFPRLRSLLLDMLGIASFAAGHVESSPPITAAVIRLDPEEGPATAIGMSRRFSWLYAALLNGAYAHSLDFDDTNMVQIGHPGAPVYAALLSDAERLDADGRAFFEAAAIGYEVACRVGGALTEDTWFRGFHMTSVSGIFGAVAAVAKLRGFDQKTTESAFGLALSKAAGSMQYLANGAWNKRLHPGFAAHDALLCAGLAEAGVLGAAQALEGEHGLLHAYTDKCNPASLVDGLGKDWVLMKTAVKPYPSCRMTHGAVDATLELRNRIPADARADASFEVEISAAGIEIVGGSAPAKLQPSNAVDAQFSIYFQVAAAWADGQIAWSVYDRLSDPALTSLLKRIEVVESDNIPNAGAVVTVKAAGRTETSKVVVPLGEPENWIGDDGLRHKFMLLAEATYGNEQAAILADTVLRFIPEEPIRKIIKLLHVHAAA